MGVSYSAVVVAQLVERVLPKQDICGSNPVIGESYLLSTILKTVLKRRELRKEAGNGPTLKSCL